MEFWVRLHNHKRVFIYSCNVSVRQDRHACKMENGTIGNCDREYRCPRCFSWATNFSHINLRSQIMKLPNVRFPFVSPAPGRYSSECLLPSQFHHSCYKFPWQSLIHSRELDGFFFSIEYMQTMVPKWQLHAKESSTGPVLRFVPIWQKGLYLNYHVIVRR